MLYEVITRFQTVVVDQPSVADTISILRGLKERYEVHHGVRIQDSALVSAAVLSNRYLTNRFLPDKAIDLVDEAASRLKMEIVITSYSIHYTKLYDSYHIHNHNRNRIHIHIRR